MKHCSKIGLTLALLLCFALFSSCAGGNGRPHNTQVALGDGIDAQVRTAARQVYGATLEELQNGGAKAILPLPEECYTPLVEDSGRVAEFSPALSLGEIVAGKGETLEEVHVMFGRNITGDQRIECGDFHFTLTAYSNEMYVVLAAFEQGHITTLVYTAFALEQGEWKLYEVRWDDYAYEGLHAAALFEKAEQLAGQKMVVPAAVYAYCAGRTLTPCGIVYNFNDKVAEGVGEYIDAVNLRNTFPHSLLLEEADEDNPKQAETGDTVVLLGFEPVVTTEEGISVVVKYVTKTDIEDVVRAREDALKAEENGEELEPLTQRQIAANERTVEKLTEEAGLILQYIDQQFAGITETFAVAHMAAFNKVEADEKEAEPGNDASENENAEEAPQYKYIHYVMVEPMPTQEESAI